MALSSSSEELVFQCFASPLSPHNNAILIYRLSGPLDVGDFLQGCLHYLDLTLAERRDLDTAYRPSEQNTTAADYLQYLDSIDPNCCIYEYIKQLTSQPYDLSSAIQPHLFLLRQDTSLHYFVVNTFEFELTAPLSRWLLQQIWQHCSDAGQELQPTLVWPEQELQQEPPPSPQQLDYWRQQLDGIPLFTPLPLQPERSGRFVSRQFGWPLAELQTWQQLAEQLDTEVMPLLAAAFSCSLGLLIGQSQLLISARDLSRLSLQPLASSLPLRCDLRAGSVQAQSQALIEQFRQARQQGLSALTAVLLEKRQHCGSGAGLNIDFSQTLLSELELSADPVAVAPVPVPWTTTEDYDLSLQFELAADHWHFQLLANAAHFCADDLSALQQQMQDFGLELAAQLSQASSVRGLCLHQCFQQRAQQKPHQLALVDGNTKLSYRQLDQLSDQLAALLHTKLASAGPVTDQPVLLMLSRSWHAIVAMLAVLKAGAAYVPLDPDVPAERLQYIASDCQAALLLTETALQHLAPTGPEVLSVDQWLNAALAQSDRIQPDHSPAIPAVASPGQLAYILYTSGTTGQPKGVMVEHRSILNTLEALRPLYAVPGARVAAFTSFVFDVSVSEIFATLLAGNTLHLLSQPVRQDAYLLSQYLKQHNIHLVYLPPAMLAVLPRVPYPALCQIIFAGEPCDQKVGAYFAARYALYNYYGPTETSIYATGKRVDPADVNEIGYALPNICAYVLDEQLRPVAIGATGELYLSGPGLARGYLNKPQQTAQSFIANPYAAQHTDPAQHSRLYKTGDLVRSAADGNLKYLGRNDFQVKIHGFRIELGEIEAALSALDPTGQCLVLVKERNGLKRLVAYYQALQAVDEQWLRGQLAKRLPGYMLPHYFVALQAFPLNTNGKIDRQLLPEPNWPRHVGAVPQNAQEQQMLALWQQVLQSDQFGVTDNFFLAGGDSLAAMRLSLLLRQHQFAASTALLYQHNTVRSLCQHLHQAEQQPLRYQALVPDQLNEMQQLILNHQLLTSPVVYNENLSIDFAGMALCEQALQQALRRFINHHPALRLCVDDDLRHYSTSAPLELGPVLLHEVLPDALEPAQQEQHYQQRLSHWLNRPFDLQQGPLYRFVLFSRQQLPCKLVFIHHHLIGDGEAMYNLFVPQLYALLKDPLATLPPQAGQPMLPAPLAPDPAWLAALQRVDLFQGKRSSQSDGLFLRYAFSTEQTRQLEQLAWHHKISLYALLQSLVAVLVCKFSGQSRFSLGGVKSARGLGTDGLYGNFLCNDISHCELNAQQSFIQLAKERFADIQQRLDQFFSYQLLLERLRQDGEPDDRLPGVYLTLEPKSNIELPWRISQNDALPAQVKYPLYFEFDHQQQLLLRLEYRTCVYSTAQAEQLLQALCLLTDQCLSAPHSSLAALQVLPAAQRQALLAPPTATPAIPEEQLLQLWQQSVSRFGTQTAIHSNEGQWTYQQLDRESSQLALLIRQQIEVSPDDLIALLLPRGWHTVLAILAVLKAGAAYVPVDVSYPAERIGFILQDTAAPLVLTSSAFTAQLTGYQGKCLVLDQADWSTLDPAQLQVTVTPAQLAYVIYTSGSTGKPKGVLLEHRQVARLLRASEANYGFNNQDVWCLFHSYVFDFSVWELWGALAYGGTLLIPSLAQVQDTEQFVQFCATHGLTVLNQTPSAFYNFSAEACRHERLKALRYVIFGGEALNLVQLTGWFSHYGDQQPLLVNMYGITETTVHVTYKAIHLGDIGELSLIGRPLADLQALVLDAELQPVPAGVTGELYISGAGLARGYLNRPELTAERFIRHPYPTPGFERLYKTGDLARYNAEGELDYSGRIDNQVKIRGYRIELGEIEAALSAISGISQCLVLARETPSGKVLVAYYRADQTLDPSQLAGRLSQSLPPHMVPVHYLQVDEFRLTVNGKLDRNALPAPVVSHSTKRVAPVSPQEQQACAIWQEELAVPQIGLTDDFFRSGGDSISAIRVVARLKALGLGISVRDIFQHRTIAALLAQASQLSQDQPPAYQPFSLVSPQVRQPFHLALDDLYPATQLQQGMFVETEKNAAVYHNIEVNLVTQPFDEARFVRVWQQLVDKHQLLRASYHKDPALGYLTLVHSSLSVQHKITQYQDYSSAYQQELQTPIPTDQAGLFRLALVKEPQQFRLLFTSHHAIEDGWSVASLLSEFIHCYSQDLVPQSGHALSFAHYVQQELQALSDPQQRQFWVTYLKGYEPGQLQLRDSKPAAAEPVLLEVSHPLSAAQCQQALQLAFAQSVPVDSLFLAPYFTLLQLFTDSSDLCVGLVVNNRLEQLGGDSQFGLHLNTMPLRIQLEQAQTTANSSHALVTAIQQQRLQLMPYKVYPYSQVKIDLAQEQDLYQAAFNYIHFYQKQQTLANTGARLLDVQAITNIPLALVVSRDGDQFELSLQGHSHCVDQPHLQLMLQHYLHQLQQLLDQGQVTELLTPTHRSALLASQQPDLPPAPALLHSWSDAVRRFGTAVAVQDAQDTLSFEALDRQSCALAAQLQPLLQQSPATKAGSQPLVAVLTRRHNQMLVAILAVLKTGAAYVPVDPAYPADRIQFMLQDCGASLLLGEARWLSLRQHAPELPWLTLDAPLPQSGGDSFRQVTVPAEALVNVIYTSGTTGRPKGVMVQQQGLINLIQNQQQLFQLNPSDRVLQFASFSFDAASWEIFATLLSGARLVICPDSCKENPAALLQLLEQQQISVATLPPALLNLMPEHELPALRLLIVAGEATPEETMRRWSQGRQLVNAYGPTETTVCSTVHFYQAGDSASRIGRALAGLHCYVLTSQGGLAPYGVPGELCVSGIGIAKGYLHRPELTEERFVANPFDLRPEHQRLYRTGDKVRLLLDGSLDYLGRIDHQVKIRGHRVELTEIEAVVRQYPGVGQAAAVVRQLQDQQVLAAYLTSEPIAPAQEDMLLTNWNQVYEAEYGKKTAADLNQADFDGWNSSYTGQPVELKAMHEWRDATVARILAQQPRRILELGSGAGLLFYPLLSAVDFYFATDFSAQAIAKLRFGARELAAEHKTAFAVCDAASFIQVLEDYQPDLIIINSVVQYFPSRDYLLQVLRHCETLLAGRGKVFLGDLRDQRLLEQFHYSIARYRLPDAAEPQLRQLAQQLQLKDKELLIAPQFFLQPQLWPQCRVDLRLKAGQQSSEMLDYRYDVLLDFSETSQSPAAPALPARFYFSKNLQLAELCPQHQSGFVVHHYPNLRLYPSYLQHSNQPADEALSQVLNYHQLQQLAQHHQLDFYALPEPDHIACMTLVFSRNQAALCSRSLFQSPELPLAHWVREPYYPLDLQAIRQFLEQRLPAYMVPNHLVQLERLPLTANGKLDRKALPEPDTGLQHCGYQAPVTELEQQLCRLWQEVLGVARVGTQDDFFQLGGHSILAIRLVQRIAEQVQRELTVAALFEHRTIAALIEHGLHRQQLQIQPAASDEKPLSFAQNRLWFLEQYDPDNGAYHIPLWLKLHSADTSWLPPVLHRLVERHQVLRSVYRPAGDSTVLQLEPVSQFSLQQLQLEPDQLEARVQACIGQPFALQQQLPIRATVLQAGPDCYLLLVIHHIAFDGWSVDLLQHELALGYQQYQQHQPLLPDELPLQYSDFALWQQQFLSGPELKRQLAYWQQQLQGFSPLQLPLQHQRPKNFDYRGADLQWSLPAGLSQQLLKLAKEQQITANSLLLAAYKLLLFKYTGQQDLLLGVPVANRHYAGTQSIIGFFVNALPVRCLLDPAQSFTSWAQLVHQQLVQAQGHQDVPFELIVDSLQLERDSSRHPVFQLMFALQNFGQTPHEPFERLDTSALYPVAKHDLTWFIRQQQDQLVLELNYASSLFSAGFIRQMAASYQLLLEQLVTTPQQALRHFSLAQQALLPSALTPRQWPEQHLLEFWQQRLAQQPAQLALCEGTTSLSVAELDQQANRLAQQLIRHIRLGQTATQALAGNPTALWPDPVAICLPRSPHMLVALLACLKLGLPYLPVDPQTPAGRVAFMLQDSHARLLLTQASLLALLPAPESLACTVLCMDTLEQQPDDGAASQAPVMLSGAAADQLVYMLYTSGTTGQPKGVLVSQQNLVNYLANLRQHQVLDGQKVDFSSSLAFDLSVTTSLAALLLGAPIQIFREEQKYLDQYSQHLRQHQISFAKLVPSLAEQLFLQYPELQLEVLMLGGEKLKASTKALLQRHCKRLLDEYGPTETTVGACLADLSRDQGIGRPYQNILPYVLDAQMQPLPPGVWGELYLAGWSVALGYLNRPELTAQRFLPNPFCQQPGFDRLYRTGDLVRYLESGELEYQARTDSQVKLRGYRIELAEIEAALLAQPGIRQALVLLRQLQPESDQRSGQLLVAYYVAEQPQQSEQLHRALAQLLPHYMLPGAFVALPALPLTLNGKLDERQLPAPDLLAQSQTAADTPVEQQLLTIWQQCLGAPELGVEQDFFRAGGDSILSISLVSRLRQAGFAVTVRQIFDCRTVRALARELSAQPMHSAQAQISSQLPAQYGLLPVQHWFFQQLEQGLLPEPQHWNQSFFIRVPRLDPSRLQQALNALLKRQPQLCARFARDPQGRWQHQFRPDSGLTLTLLKAKNQTGLQQSLNQLQQRLNFIEGPLLHVAYIELADQAEQPLLFICAHHLLLDAVSWRIIASDLAALYQQQSPAPVRSQYPDWVAYLAAYPAQQPQEAAYWQQQQSALQEALQQLPAISTAWLDYQIDFSPALTQALLGPAHQAYDSQVNDLLLTALYQAMGLCFGNQTLALTMESHGRHALPGAPDCGHTVGWYTSLYPVCLKTDLAPEANPDWGQLLRCVKQQLRQVPNQGLGFGAFASALQLELPPVQLNYLGVLDADQNDGQLWTVQLDQLSEGLSPQNQSPLWLSLNGAVEQGCLSFSLRSRFPAPQSEQLAAGFQRALEALVDHCLAQPVASLAQQVPADFGLPCSLAHYDQLLRRQRLEAIWPASSLQQGFIAHMLAQPDDDAYRVQLLLDYPNELNTCCYQQAWQLAVQHYPALRTSFDWTEQPLQLVHPKAQAQFELLDFSDQPQPERQLTLLQQQDRLLPFDLSRPCPLRLYLVRLAPAHYALLRSEHHSISDGWSGSRLMEFVHQCYLALCQGQTPSHEQDHSWHQAQRYMQRQQQAALAQWQHWLPDERTDLSALFDLCSGQSAEPLPVTQVASVQRSLDLEALQHSCREQGITLNSLLQFGWHHLLARYCFSPSTVVGTTLAGRALPVPGIEHSVGLYINTLPLQLHWDQGLTVLQQLQQIGLQVAQMNQCSFVNLASLQRGRGRLFDSIVVFENYPDVESPAALPFSYRAAIEKVNYPLVLVAWQQQGQLQLKLDYSSSHLSAGRAELLLSQLQQLLLSLPDQLQSPVTQLRSGQTDVICLQGPQRALPTLHWLPWFEQSARLYASQPALLSGQQQLSYAQLNQAANRLAHYLLTELQPAQDAVIALCMDKSLQMVIAILAIQKAGAAYLPLAPDAPAQRLQYMLTDSQALVVLADAGAAARLEKLSSAAVWCLDQLDLGSCPDHNPALERRATDLAYLIYTSGTSGQPKGVQIEQAGLVNICASQQQTLGLSPQSRILQFSNYVFDASVYEIFPALCSGASLHLLPTALQTDLPALEQYLCQHSISHAFISTAVLKQLPDLSCSALQLLYTGGEALQGLRRLPHCRLLNQYGPTEVSVCSLQAEVGSLTDIPIGRPVQNCRAYLLDPWQQPALPGAVAELYLSGPGLARGYLNQPELEQQVFLANPFSQDSDYRRLYKTGDLVRQAADGQLHYLGRRDQQVKIRGYRIELAEIELQIRTLAPELNVWIHPWQQGQQQLLVAYYLAGTEVDLPELQAGLCNLLPDYMRPAAWVALTQLPFTASGKVDKAALPAPEFNHSSAAPETELQRQLHQCWQQLLNVPALGIDDDFYQLGGDSILAIRLTQLINQQLHLTGQARLNVAAVLQQKTIRALALTLQQQSPPETMDSGEI
ncbi:amino acid adenylation domain-containing protein [Rheinheimera sp.]|uniref:amino acid adenylation domain-containing protein n=1 Tax=Rheinheimera sp. TaxID=1869214 RepID=UPI00307D55CF